MHPLHRAQDRPGGRGHLPVGVRGRVFFADRRGFTYTVLGPDDEVIGCLYIYPPLDTDPPGTDANVRSWVRADHVDRDLDLYRAVVAWLSGAWPFTSAVYATRLSTTG
jgi:hypothetical protein